MTDTNQASVMSEIAIIENMVKQRKLEIEMLNDLIAKLEKE